MRVVIQRVASASVHVEGKTVRQIESGLLVLLGVAEGNGETDGRNPVGNKSVWLMAYS